MNFFLITGPPAVGKMTVGQALADRMEYKLFHNHVSIEMALSLFWFGSDGFRKLNEGIRQLVFKTVAENKELKGFIFTLVWEFDLKEDWDYVANLKKQFTKEGWTFHIIELLAPLETRLERNKTPNRIAAKKSKSNIEKSEENVLKMDQKYRMNSKEGEIKDPNYVRIDNTDKSPEEVVDIIVERFNF